jgi:hypothetical protein
MAQSNPSRTRQEMAEENERLWSKLEELYGALGEIFEDEIFEDDEEIEDEES